MCNLYGTTIHDRSKFCKSISGTYQNFVVPATDLRLLHGNEKTACAYIHRVNASIIRIQTFKPQ
jgi:hypothetical protein